MNEYEQMSSVFHEAKLGSFLLLPLKYDKAMLDTSWLESNGEFLPIKTMDINESVKKTINDKHNQVLSRYRISRSAVMKALFGNQEIQELYAREKGETALGTGEKFEIHTLELYIFHTQVAFLSVQIRYERMKLLDTICNLGYTDDSVEYFYRNKSGAVLPFDFQAGLKNLCAKLQLAPFYSGDSPLFLEAYTYTLALVSQRFTKLETMRQATFNLHLMVEMDTAVEDESEEDVNFVYSVKDQSIGSYRWGCCVTNQTTSYVVADKKMDLDGEMLEQAENGVPVVLLALYQKYTCLRFKELIAVADEKKGKLLKSLKNDLLEFQAYGTITPSNISRWHNVRRFYTHVMDTNGVTEAVDDISITLNLLAERQKEIDTAKSEAIMGLITIFSIVSIPTSIIGLIDVFNGGNSLNIITTVITLVSIALITIVIALYKDRT